ncbi:MAG: DUF4190 domain-containing protein [Bacteroidales bacterium]|nr:DUF4190 domain-containing protein [Bacteroidales bacterium]
MEVIGDRPDESSKTCHSCGAEISNDAFFCSKCGVAVGSSAGRKFDFQERRYYSRHKSSEETLAIISLFITVIGFFTSGFIGPLIGVIIAHVALSRIDRSREEPGARRLAVTSLAVGYFFLILGLILLIAFGFFVGSSVMHGTHGSLYGWRLPWWR